MLHLSEVGLRRDPSEQPLGHDRFQVDQGTRQLRLTLNPALEAGHSDPRRLGEGVDLK